MFVLRSKHRHRRRPGGVADAAMAPTSEILASTPEHVAKGWPTTEATPATEKVRPTFLNVIVV